MLLSVIDICCSLFYNDVEQTSINELENAVVHEVKEESSLYLVTSSGKLITLHYICITQEELKLIYDWPFVHVCDLIRLIKMF